MVVPARIHVDRERQGSRVRRSPAGANVSPLMRPRGFSEAEVQAIFVDNPRRLLTLDAGPT